MRAPNLIANARMYAVSPDVEAVWRHVLAEVARTAGVSLTYQPYPAPQPLEALWTRGDLGCVFMCGYPIALQLADVIPLAAPIPNAPWANGRAVYRSDLIVRTDAPFKTLEDTFGRSTGWTVEHSQSGFNAWRHHLLQYRTVARPTLYRTVHGHLITARRVLDDVSAGIIDVGPLDAYWHMLIRQHNPTLTAGVRILASTAAAPMPALVASAGTDPEVVTRLRSAFASAHTAPWFAAAASALLITGFAAVDHATFAATLVLDQTAVAAGYPAPA
jgi:ABC-type phosphate/phosphonate transport system substrate-binding protein